MKKVVFSVLVLVCFGASSAFAGQSYVSVGAGLFMPSDSTMTDPELEAMGITKAEVSFDSGFEITAAAGKDLDVVRVEGEISYKTADMDEVKFTDFLGDTASGSIEGDINSLSLLFNVWKDIKNSSSVTPYFGLGLGVAKLDAEIEGSSESDTVFAYQVGVGTYFKINDGVDLDLSYRYFATSDPKFDTTSAEFASHNVLASVRFGF